MLKLELTAPPHWILTEVDLFEMCHELSALNVS